MEGSKWVDGCPNISIVERVQEHAGVTTLAVNAKPVPIRGAEVAPRFKALKWIERGKHAALKKGNHVPHVVVGCDGRPGVVHKMGALLSAFFG